MNESLKGFALVSKNNCICYIGVLCEVFNLVCPRSSFDPRREKQPPAPGRRPPPVDVISPFTTAWQHTRTFAPKNNNTISFFYYLQKYILNQYVKSLKLVSIVVTLKVVFLLKLLHLNFQKIFIPNTYICCGMID